MESYNPENTDAFSAPNGNGNSSNDGGGGGVGGGGGSRSWHQPQPYAAPAHSPSEGGRFQPDPFNMANLQPGLPPYANLNIPNHGGGGGGGGGGQGQMDDMGPSRRRSGSGGSEMNSEAGSPLTGARAGVFPVAMSASAVPAGMIAAPNPLAGVLEGSSLFESLGMSPGSASNLATTSGPIFSAAFASGEWFL